MGALQWMPQVLIGIAVMVLVIYGIFFNTMAKQRRRMRALKIVRIADAKDGELVRVVGVVEPMTSTATSLVAPFSSRESVYFYAALFQSAGRNGWRITARQEEAVPFRVRDASGTMVVDLGQVPARNSTLHGGNDGELNAALVDAAQDYSSTSGTFTDPSPAQKKFLEDRGVPLQTSLLQINNSFKYTEKIIAVGETVCLVGIARHEPEIDGDGTITPGPEYRGSARKLRVTLVAPPNGRVGVSDNKRTTA